MIKIHLPGLYTNFNLNKEIVLFKKYYPEYFEENIDIGSIYGTFPPAIWNGGRYVEGNCSYNHMAEILDFFNKHNIPCRFTFTNNLITHDMLNDYLCNYIMKLGNNGLNEVIVNSNILEQYIRLHYSKYPIISSVSKSILNKSDIMNELNKPYKLVVLDTNFNNDLKTLLSFGHPEKIELLALHGCVQNCPYRIQHYINTSKQVLGINEADNNFTCPTTKYKKNGNNVYRLMKLTKSNISRKTIKEYATHGIVNFKLDGRLWDIYDLIEAYSYYLFNDRYRDEARLELYKKIVK